MHLIRHLLGFLSLSAWRTRTLRTNFLWNAFGNAVFALGQWGTLVVFAKLGSPALVGQVVYGLALAAPLFVIAGMQLRTIQATDVHNRYAFGKYLGLRALTTAAAIIVTLVIAMIMWAAGSQVALIIVLWGFAKTVDSGSDALYGFFQQAERMDYVGVSLVLRGLLSIAIIAILFRMSHSAPIALAGLVAGWGTVLVLFDVPMARLLLRHSERRAYPQHAAVEAFHLVLNRRDLTALCREAAPLGLVVFLLTIQAQIPRYVIAALLRTRELGLFSAAAYITFIGSMLVNALGAPACVRLAQYHAAGVRTAFHQLMMKLLWVAAALGGATILVSVFAGGRVLVLLYTKEYSSMAAVLTMLCVGSALLYLASFLGYGMTALMRYRVQVPIGLSVVVISIVSCYWLTKCYGLTGTAVGIIIANFAQLLMCAAVVWRATRRDGAQGAASSCPIGETAESVP